MKGWQGVKNTEREGKEEDLGIRVRIGIGGRKGPGQAAARGQFALFDKGRALNRWYQRHGAGSKVRVKGCASRGGGSGVEHEHDHEHEHEEEES